MTVQSIGDDRFKQFIQLHKPFYGYIAPFTVSYFYSDIMSPFLIV